MFENLYGKSWTCDVAFLRPRSNISVPLTPFSNPSPLGLSGLSGLLIAGFNAGFAAIDLARIVISELFVLSSVFCLVKTALHIDAVVKPTFCWTCSKSLSFSLSSYDMHGLRYPRKVAVRQEGSARETYFTGNSFHINSFVKLLLKTQQ